MKPAGAQTAANAAPAIVKKSSPNGKLTIYGLGSVKGSLNHMRILVEAEVIRLLFQLGKRDFYSYRDYTENIDGVVLIEPTFLKKIKGSRVLASLSQCKQNGSQKILLLFEFRFINVS